MKILFCAACQDDELAIKLRLRITENGVPYADVYECSKCGFKIVDIYPEDHHEDFTDVMWTFDNHSKNDASGGRQ